MFGNIFIKTSCKGFIFLCIIMLHVSVVYGGDVTLSWDPPTTNVDNSPLTDLAGFMLYSRTSSGNYTDGIDVGNVTTYQLTGLTEGLTYFFVTTAYDTAGNESGDSNEVSKLIEITGSPLLGDVNGDDAVTIVDALFVAQYAAGASVNINPEAADVNCDANINIVDSLFISRYAAGLEVTEWCG